MAGPNIELAVAQHLIKASEVIENQLDAELERLDNMDEDDMDALRQKRMLNMKKIAKQKQDWLAQGHGQYSELSCEKDFFDESKNSKNMVCHFYRDSTFRCKIVDKHLHILAPKHLETKFVKLSVDKCKFLIDKLHIKVLPTICLVAEGKTIDYIVGFDDLGGKDDFSTDMLEWRLGVAGVINYSGDLMNPPTDDSQKKASILGYRKAKKTIRDGDDSSDDDGNDWE